MDEKILKYRKKHKKCKYCKYIKLEVPHIDSVTPYFVCTVKDKIIQGVFPDMTNVLRFCSYYEVNEKE